MFQIYKKYLREMEHRLYIVFRFRNTVPYGKGRPKAAAFPRFRELPAICQKETA